MKIVKIVRFRITKGIRINFTYSQNYNVLFFSGLISCWQNHRIKALRRDFTKRKHSAKSDLLRYTAPSKWGQFYVESFRRKKTRNAFFRRGWYHFVLNADNMNSWLTFVNKLACLSTFDFELIKTYLHYQP